MIRIFLSTKSASLQSLFAKDDNPIERAKVDALTIDQINNFIALSHNGEIVNDNTVSQIFLLFDGLESIPTGLVIDKVNDYLLYHNATKEGIKKQLHFY
jgi:hypothetical protein